MIPCRQTLAIAALAVSVSGLAPGSAMAQNPNFTPGDLILAFQNPGGATGADQTVMIRLGNSATDFRDATTDRINFLNIGSTLVSAFGANWWEAQTLHMSLLGVWNSSNLGTGPQNGDPTRTLYVSRARTEVGTPGQFGSVPWFLGQDGNMTTAANGMINVQNVLETDFTTAAAISPTTDSRVDDQNPFVGDNQGTAYGVFPGGVQFKFGTGSFGSFGIAGNVEAALDLNRIQARNNIAGQFGFGATVRDGTFEGTLTINQAGDLSFVTVPEPSIAALLCAGAIACGFTRRRRSSITAS